MYPTKKTTRANDVTPKVTREPISLPNLSAQHHETAIQIVEKIADINEELFQETDTESVDKGITTILEMMAQATLHFETAKTLNLLQTISTCPNCGYDLTNRDRHTQCEVSEY